MGFLSHFFKKHKNTELPSLTVQEKSKLSTFSDVDLGLFWNRITPENLAENEKYFKQMSKWATNINIQKYISRIVPIDELFRSFVVDNGAGGRRYDDKSNLYLCFNENKVFIGVAYISAPIGQNKDSVIDYLVVNPDYQGVGIGTKMIKSISSSINYFNNGYQSDGIYASVNYENEASTKALLKNSFKVVSGNWTDLGKYYNVLYLSKRNMENYNQDFENEQ